MPLSTVCGYLSYIAGPPMHCNCARHTSKSNPSLLMLSEVCITIAKSYSFCYSHSVLT